MLVDLIKFDLITPPEQKSVLKSSLFLTNINTISDSCEASALQDCHTTRCLTNKADIARLSKYNFTNTNEVRKYTELYK